MAMHPPAPFHRRLGGVVAVYGAWLVTAALGALIFYVWLGAARELYIRFQWDKWGFAAFHDVVAIVLALGWLGLVVGAEGWYRHAAGSGPLAGRFARLTVIQVVLLVAGYLVLWLA